MAVVAVAAAAATAAAADIRGMFPGVCSVSAPSRWTGLGVCRRQPDVMPVRGVFAEWSRIVALDRPATGGYLRCCRGADTAAELLYLKKKKQTDTSG